MKKHRTWPRSSRNTAASPQWLAVRIFATVQFLALTTAAAEIPPTLLFRSGFETTVAIDNFTKLTGTDTESGFSWDTLSTAAGCVNRLEYVGAAPECAFADLRDDVERGGRTLHFQVNSNDVSTGASPVTRASMSLNFSSTGLAEGYARFRMKLSGAYADGLDVDSKAWLQIMELWDHWDSEKDTEEIATLHMGVERSGNKQYHLSVGLRRRDPATGTYTPIWKVANPAVPFEFGKWLDVEMRVVTGPAGTARVFYALDGRTVFDIRDKPVGLPEDPHPFRRWQIFKIYQPQTLIDYMRDTGTLCEAWYDDLELWDGPPPQGIAKGQTNTKHYVYIAESYDLLGHSLVVDNPDVAGVQVKYTWRQLEPSPDVYDLSLVRSHYDTLAAKGKRLILQFQDKSFNVNDMPVPDYLTETTNFNGGAHIHYRKVDDVWTQNGWIARRWDPVVQERYRLLFLALGREFSGKVDAVNFCETAVNFPPGEAPPGFDAESYRTGLIDLMKHLRNGFSGSSVILYLNFVLGGPTVLADIADACVSRGIGLGGPDILVNCENTLTNAYKVWKSKKGLVPLVAACQGPDYSNVNPATGNPQTPEETYVCARGFLTLDAMTWCYLQPYYSQQGTNSVTNVMHRYRNADAFGIPDWWKVRFFGSITTEEADASEDPDGDGMTNLGEYLAGTNPTNAADVLKIANLTSGGISSTNLTLSWSSVAGKSYAIRTSTNLLVGFDGWAVTNIPATPTMNTQTVVVDQVESRFYRVTVEP